LIKQLLSIAFCCLCAANLWSQIRPEINDMASRLNRVAIGSEVKNRKSSIFFRDSIALNLQQKATIAELMELTNHDLPIVRVNALIALLGRPERDSLELQLLVPQHFSDTATVFIEMTENKANHSKAKVGELFLDMIGRYSDWYMLWTNTGFKLSEPRQLWLDSVFFCSNTDFNYLKNFPSRSWKPRPELYDCIRQMVESGQDNYTTLFLAKYQREEDIELICSHLPEYINANKRNHFIWLSFQYFQHPRMFSCLKSKLEDGWQNLDYYRNVAKYKNEEAAKLMDSILTRIIKMDKYKGTVTAHFGRALEEEFAPAFADIYLKLLKTFPENSNLKIPDMLWETHGDTLLHLSSIWKNGNKVERERATIMIPQVIKYLKAKDVNALNTEIVSRLKPLPDTYYSSVRAGDEGATIRAYKYIYNSQHSYFIEPLFERLKAEPLAKNRFFIAKLLLEFEDHTIRGRLTAFFKENPNLAPSLKDAEEGGKFFKNFIHNAKQP
jgi:hypothetical protein